MSAVDHVVGVALIAAHFVFVVLALAWLWRNR